MSEFKGFKKNDGTLIPCRDDSKQATLTTQQLAAVNSGITSEKVAKIATIDERTANVSQLARDVEQISEKASAKWGVVSQTQNWTSASSVYSYTMSNIVNGWIPSMFIDMMAEEGVVFNETTGYFELNGLTDISYKEMINIYNKTNGSLDGINHRNALMYVNARTNMKPKVHSAETTSPASCIDDMFCCFNYSNFEVINLDCTTGRFYANNVSQCFSNCTYLKRVFGVISIAKVTSAINYIINNSKTLETIYLKYLSANINLSGNNVLSKESIKFAIDNAGTTAVSIKLSSSVYNMAVADADIQASLAAKTNVSLASE